MARQTEGEMGVKFKRDYWKKKQIKGEKRNESRLEPFKVVTETTEMGQMVEKRTEQVE